MRYEKAYLPATIISLCCGFAGTVIAFFHFIIGITVPFYTVLFHSLMTVFSVMYYILLIAYGVHIMQNKQLSKGNRAIWILVIIIANVFGMLAYSILYTRKIRVA